MCLLGILDSFGEALWLIIAVAGERPGPGIALVVTEVGRVMAGHDFVLPATEYVVARGGRMVGREVGAGGRYVWSSRRSPLLL